MPVKAKRIAGLGSEPEQPALSDAEAQIAAKAERLAICEAQLGADRAESLRVLALVGKGIAAWQERGLTWDGFAPECSPSEWKGLHKLMYLVAQLHWLEARITQLDMMATPLWCPSCNPGGSFPGAMWMKFECIVHAEAMNMRTAMNLGRSWFGGVLSQISGGTKGE